jgi:hypothetical protein
MSLAAAEKLLNGKSVANTAFQSFPIGTLAKLCGTYGILVKATGKRGKGTKIKSDYIAAIYSFVSRQ